MYQYCFFFVICNFNINVFIYYIEKAPTHFFKANLHTCYTRNSILSNECSANALHKNTILSVGLINSYQVSTTTPTSHLHTNDFISAISF